MRKFNPAVHAKREWLSGFAERNTLLGLHFNHIIVAPALPQEIHMRRYWSCLFILLQSCITKCLIVSVLYKNIIQIIIIKVSRVLIKGEWLFYLSDISPIVAAHPEPTTCYGD